MTKIADDTLAVGGPAADFDTWAPPAGLFAANSLLHACRAACDIFAWDEPAELQTLLDQVDAKIAAINRAGDADESTGDQR
jgi:hypothetical protein